MEHKASGVKLRALADELREVFSALHDSDFLSLSFLTPDVSSSMVEYIFHQRLLSRCKALPPLQLANVLKCVGRSFYTSIVKKKYVDALLECLVRIRVLGQAVLSYDGVVEVRDAMIHDLGVTNNKYSDWVDQAVDNVFPDF